MKVWRVEVNVMIVVVSVVGRKERIVVEWVGVDDRGRERVVDLRIELVKSGDGVVGRVVVRGDWEWSRGEGGR